MIQRIQSIFLLLSSAAGFGVLALPFAISGEGVQSSTLFSDKAYTTGDNIGLLVLFAVAGALSLAAIFLYGNRQLQLKIGRAALAANILGIVLASFLFWQDFSNVSTNGVGVGYGLYLPALFVLFTGLALRAIKKDEALVRSADRLR